MRIAVLGGGVSGLAAAWELSDRSDVQVTVVEADDRLGGKIRTSRLAGRDVDEGPDAVLRRVPDALRLFAEVGVDDLVCPARGDAAVWIDGALRPLPGGLVLGVPASFDALERSGILTSWGMARARHEPEVPGEPLTDDTSIGDLVRRRYGSEVADRLVGPLLGGISAGAIDDLSLDAVTPQLARAARRSTSVATALASDAAAATPGEPVFAAPRRGMGELIDRLASRLAARGVEIVTGVAAGTLPDADGVVVATPAPQAVPLLAGRSPEAAELLAAVEHASVVFTTVAFSPDDVPGPLDGSGFLVPRDAGLTITAVSWSSSKWEHLGGGDVILRVAMGHSRDPRPVEMDDDEILAVVRRDLRTTMGIDAAPTEVRVRRFRDGFPQYAVGHLDRVDRIEAALLRDAPDLALCGMAMRGVGIPACIGVARAAASALAARLGGSR